MPEINLPPLLRWFRVPAKLPEISRKHEAQVSWVVKETHYISRKKRKKNQKMVVCD
jgi:hypothetical protein